MMVSGKQVSDLTVEHRKAVRTVLKKLLGAYKPNTRQIDAIINSILDEKQKRKKYAKEWVVETISKQIPILFS